MRVRLSRTSCICLTVTLLFLLPLLMGYYLYHLVTNTMANLMHRFNSEGMDILGEVPGLRQLIQDGQNGGFIKLQQNTLERLFIVTHHDRNTHNRTEQSDLDSSISFLGIDVSHSLEASYIYRRILSRRSFPFTRLIVDIGANDGFLSSNSFNYIQWGWNAVLVEPQHDKIRSAKINTKRYIDPYSDGSQHVDFVNAVIGETDGYTELVRTGEAVAMQSHIRLDEDKKLKKGESVIRVRSLTVKTLAKTFHIPHRFGILSIDAEGVGDKILHEWMRLGFQPAYVIFETRFNTESAEKSIQYMKRHGYRYLTKSGWNHIFELTTWDIITTTVKYSKLGNL